MFGWGRRKEPMADEKVVEAFKTSMETVSGFAPERRLAVAYGVAFTWKLFNVNFSSTGHFRSNKRQRDKFFKGVDKLREEMNRRGDNDVVRGIIMTSFYFLSLVDSDAATINWMADQLEPLNREGFALV
jgi:hypothetical protein